MNQIITTPQYNKWIDKTKDPLFKKALVERLIRLQNGNFGDHKQINNDIFELRFFIGPGYRVYFVIQDGILLLLAGVKKTQCKDIKKAVEIFNNYNKE